MGDRSPLVKQSESLQPYGCCLEFIFWLHAKDVYSYEHDTSDIVEYIYAKSADFGLQIYQMISDK